MRWPADPTQRQVHGFREATVFDHAIDCTAANTREPGHLLLLEHRVVLWLRLSSDGSYDSCGFVFAWWQSAEQHQPTLDQGLELDLVELLPTLVLALLPHADHIRR